SIGRLSYYLSGGLIKWPARRTHDAHHLAFFTKHCLERLCRELDLTICSMNFDHLAFARTDGAWWVRAVAAGLMNLERCFGRGLVITLAVKKFSGTVCSEWEKRRAREVGVGRDRWSRKMRKDRRSVPTIYQTSISLIMIPRSTAKVEAHFASTVTQDF